METYVALKNVIENSEGFYYNLDYANFSLKYLLLKRDLEPTTEWDKDLLKFIELHRKASEKFELVFNSKFMNRQ